MWKLKRALVVFGISYLVPTTAILVYIWYRPFQAYLRDRIVDMFAKMV